MKLALKLFLGFFSVVMLTAFVGLIGMDCTGKLGKKIQEVEQVHIPGAVALLTAANAAHRASLHALEYSLRGRQPDRTAALESIGEIEVCLENYQRASRKADPSGPSTPEEMDLQTRAKAFDQAARVYLVYAGGLTFDAQGMTFQDHPGPTPSEMFAKEDDLNGARKALVEALHQRIEEERRVLAALAGEASETARSTSRVILAAAMGAFLLALFQGVMMSRSISRPLARLMAAASEIGKGRLDTPIDTEADGEIGLLGKSLEQMALNMKESRKKLIHIDELEQAREALEKSENLLQTLIDSTRDAIIAIDENGLVTLFNLAGEKMFLRSRTEMIGKPVDCLMPKDFRAGHDQKVHSFFTTGKPDAAMGKILELPAVRGDGLVFPMEISLSAGEAESRQFVVAVARDISERKGIEQNIIKAKQEWERTFDTVPDLIAILDDKFEVRRVNQAMADRLGRAPADIVGMPCYELVHNMHTPLDGCPHGLCLQDGCSHEMEVYEKSLDGHFLVTASPMRDSGGAITGSVHVMRDITGRKQAEAELARTHAKLIETARQIGMAEVAAGVLHNVGNVLNSVGVAAEVIRTKVRSSKIADFRQVMELAAAHKEDLQAFLFEDSQGRDILPFLEDLSVHLETERQALMRETEDLAVYVSHISEIVKAQQERSKMPGQVASASLQDLVEEALMIHASGLEREGISVAREYQPTPRVLADRHKVMQILMNLLSNARHAMGEQDARDKQLVLRLFLKDTGRVCVQVRDNGAGITPQNMDRLFRYGFTTKKEGHGFGLHSCALAAQEMGGALNGESQGQGQGAIFTLELPPAEGDREDVGRS